MTLLPAVNFKKKKSNHQFDAYFLIFSDCIIKKKKGKTGREEARSQERGLLSVAREAHQQDHCLAQPAVTAPGLTGGPVMAKFRDTECPRTDSGSHHTRF